MMWTTVSVHRWAHTGDRCCFIHQLIITMCSTEFDWKPELGPEMCSNVLSFLKLLWRPVEDVKMWIISDLSSSLMFFRCRCCIFDVVAETSTSCTITWRCFLTCVEVWERHCCRWRRRTHWVTVWTYIWPLELSFISAHSHVWLVNKLETFQFKPEAPVSGGGGGGTFFVWFGWGATTCNRL